MVIITLVSAFALLLTYFLTKSYGDDSSQLLGSRSELVTTGIQIICGDCSGEDDLPIKTYIDRFGNCSQCGGHSYILASNRFIYTQQLVASRLLQYQAARDNSRALSYNESKLRWSLGGLTTRTY
ncbi:MAG TPA: hypothetical protein VNI02_05060 [Blastocatellia bacterium]|nr:hypothetical protein [Blastocatellia bacterium]